MWTRVRVSNQYREIFRACLFEMPKLTPPVQQLRSPPLNSLQQSLRSSLYLRVFISAKLSSFLLNCLSLSLLSWKPTLTTHDTVCEEHHYWFAWRMCAAAAARELPQRFNVGAAKSRLSSRNLALVEENRGGAEFLGGGLGARQSKSVVPPVKTVVGESRIPVHKCCDCCCCCWWWNPFTSTSWTTYF